MSSQLPVSDTQNDIHRREKRFLFNIDLNSKCSGSCGTSTVYDFISYDIKKLNENFQNSTGPFSIGKLNF